MNRKSIPIIYNILTGLAGLAAVISFHVLFRQLILLFGTHTVSTGIVILSALICMAQGSYIAGKVADKTFPPLTLFIAFTIVTGLLFLFYPFIFKGITLLYVRINDLHNPSPFRAGVLKFVFSIALLLIPVGLTAGLLPLLIKHFIKQVSHSGRYMNAAVLSLSMALVTGLPLSILLLIPKFGQHTALFTGALAYLITAAYTIVYLLRSRTTILKTIPSSRGERTKGSSIRFRKKKHVLETGAKLTRAMLQVFATQGFVMASMLLLSFRILVHYNMLKPTFFYALILFVIFIGVATGSALYNKISEKPANKYMTLATLQIFTGFGALLSYAALQIISGCFSQQLSYSQSFMHSVLVQSTMNLSFLLIPSILIGLSLPLTGRLYPKRLLYAGSSFGYLGSVFYLSLAAGSVVTAMVLIPLLGLQLTYFLLAILTTLSGIYLIFKDSRLIRGFRIGYAFSVFILLVLSIGAFRLLNFKKTDRPIDKKVEGITATVTAIKNKDHTSSVFINGQYAFGTDKNSLKTQQLAAVVPVLLNQHINTALVTGFGMGLTALKLEECGVTSIHVTEIFPEMIKLSSEVFADDNNDIMTNSHVDITTEDPRSYLMRSKNNLDLITAGHDLLFKIPGVCSIEFYRLCYSKMSENGIFCQVLPITGIKETEFAAILKSCEEVFANISLWYCSPENVLLVASKKGFNLEFCNLSSAFSAMNDNTSLTTLHLPDIESLLAHIIMLEKRPGKIASGVQENSDNRPFVEFNPGMLRGANKVLPWLLKNRTDYSSIIEFKAGCHAESAEVIKKIRLLNQLLLQHVSLSSAKPKGHAVDFFEQTGSPFQRYL